MYAFPFLLSCRGRTAVILVSTRSTAPETIVANESVTVTATVNNTGDVTVSEPITYSVGDETVATKRVRVGPDGATVTFQHTLTETGSVTHDLATATTASTASSTVRAPADIGVTSVSAPDAADVGETVTVTATVENSGGVEGTQEVTVTAGGHTVTTEAVTLQAGESTDITADVTAKSVGTLTVEASAGTAGASAETAVEAVDTPTSADESPESDQSSAGDSGPGFGVGAAIVALLAVVTAVAIRR